ARCHYRVLTSGVTLEFLAFVRMDSGRTPPVVPTRRPSTARAVRPGPEEDDHSLAPAPGPGRPRRRPVGWSGPPPEGRGGRGRPGRARRALRGQVQLAVEDARAGGALAAGDGGAAAGPVG